MVNSVEEQGRGVRDGFIARRGRRGRRGTELQTLDDVLPRDLVQLWVFRVVVVFEVVDDAVGTLCLDACTPFRERFGAQVRRARADREFPRARPRRVLETEIVLVVDEFEHGERGVVADAVAAAQDAGVPSRTVLVPPRVRTEQGVEGFLRVLPRRARGASVTRCRERVGQFRKGLTRRKALARSQLSLPPFLPQPMT